MGHSHDVEHGHEGHDHSRDTAEVSAEECADFLEGILRLIDNELEEGGCAVVRAHLDSCNPCLEKYQLQTTMKQLVARSCKESAPTELRQRVLMRLQQVRVEISDA